MILRCYFFSELSDCPVSGILQVHYWRTHEAVNLELWLSDCHPQYMMVV